jgi:hypothetical protein
MVRRSLKDEVGLVQAAKRKNDCEIPFSCPVTDGKRILSSRADQEMVLFRV